MSFVVPERFHGPPESGNGGWVSGHLASLVTTTPEQPAVSVRLSSPPPLDREMAVSDSGGAIAVHDGDVLVARGAAASAPGVARIPAPVSLDEARAASERFDFGANHPFPSCFVCGPLRDEGDGLRIFAGPVEGAAEGLVAAPWVPTESSVEFVWAALDCPGAWALDVGHFPMVLGTLTAQILALPQVGEPHVVLGWARGEDGRKRHCGTAVYAGERLVAHAEATWINIDPTTVRPTSQESA